MKTITINSSGNQNCIKIKHNNGYIKVQLIDPEPGWMRIFQKPNGKYVAQILMDAPDDWKFIKSFVYMKLIQ